MLREQNIKEEVDDRRHFECLRVSTYRTDKVNDLSDDELQRLENDLLGNEEHLEREELEDEIPF